MTHAVRFVDGASRRRTMFLLPAATRHCAARVGYARLREAIHLQQPANAEAQRKIDVNGECPLLRQLLVTLPEIPPIRKYFTLDDLRFFRLSVR